MKQHITPEQLKELTPEQTERLREWWEPQKYDVFCYKSRNRCGEFGTAPVDEFKGGYIYFADTAMAKSDCLPLLSNGQQIELLSGKENRYRFTFREGAVIVERHVLPDENIFSTASHEDAVKNTRDELAGRNNSGYAYYGACPLCLQTRRHSCDCWAPEVPILPYSAKPKEQEKRIWGTWVQINKMGELCDALFAALKEVL